MTEIILPLYHLNATHNGDKNKGGNANGTMLDYDFGCGSDCPEPMSVYSKALIVVGYSTVSLLAIGGNVTVCYIVFAYQRMRTVTNYFIVSLACSDILMAVMCIPFTFMANLLLGYWPFGHIMCPLVCYFQVVTVLLSAFTLVAICLDRFIAIICPLRQKLTTCKAYVIISCIWILALLMSFPVAIVSRVQMKPDVLSRELQPLCEEDWTSMELQRMYSTLLMVVQYFLPLFVLAVTYTWIGVVIWVKKTPGEAEQHRDQRFARSKRKMVKMMITVVIIYGICWLPLHTITLVGEAHSTIYTFKYIQAIWISCHWVAMSNCCYNPMVYCWMNSRFRIGFKHVFRFCPCIHEEDLSETNSRKVKWNYTCIYTMNLGDNGSYHRRIHRLQSGGTRDSSSSSSHHSQQRNGVETIALTNLHQCKQNNNAPSKHNRNMFS